MNNFLQFLKENKIHNVIILSGAGVSTNAGIPDYRSSTGIFKEIKLDKPEDFFSRSFQEQNPKIISEFMKKLKKEMLKAKPTPSHFLAKVLHEHKLLRRVITQNIDGLYSKVGLPKEKIVEFHGNLNDIVFYGKACGPCHCSSLKLVNHASTSLEPPSNLQNFQTLIPAT